MQVPEPITRVLGVLCGYRMTAYHTKQGGGCQESPTTNQCARAVLVLRLGPLVRQVHAQPRNSTQPSPIPSQRRS